MEEFFTMLGVIVAIIGFVVAGMAGSLKSEEEQNAAKDRSNKQDNFIKANGVNVSKEYKYESGEVFNKKQIRFVIDNVNKNLYLAETSERFMKISYDDVLGCEIMADSEVTGGVKRAIVGGILAGETGAIVGAITSKKHIMSYKLVFYMNDVIEPKKEIVLIDSKKSTQDADYKNAVEFAENIVATIKVILN